MHPIFVFLQNQKWFLYFQVSKQAKPICIWLRYFVIAFARKCLKLFSLFICFRLPQIVFLHASLYAKLVFVKDFAVYDFMSKVSDFISAYVDIGLAF